MTERIELHKNLTIYDYLSGIPQTNHQQDSKGNTVIHRSNTYILNGPFTIYRDALVGYSANCIANNGKFDIETKGKNASQNKISNAHSASLNQAASTYEFWRDLGINGTSEAMNVYYEQYNLRIAMAQSMAFIFDSAVRTENIGTFTCKDEKKSNVKWRINIDLFDVHKGYRSPSGMYNFPDAYTAKTNETIIIYEKQLYKTAKTGYSNLPENSKDIIYPTSGYYVIIELKDGKWKIISSKHFQTPAGNNISTLLLSPKRKNGNEEILIISEDGNFIMPAFNDKEVKFKYSDNYTGRNACHIDTIADRQRYSICTSAFGDEPQVYSATANLIGSLFLNQNSQYNMNLTKTISFVPEKFFFALDQANVRAQLSK